LSVTILQLLGCRVDLERGLVLRDPHRETLTARELALLAHLAARPGVVVSREELLVEVWGYAPTVVSRAVDKTMVRLRRKIERDPTCPEHLITEYGVGFSFEPARVAGLPVAPTRFIGRAAEQEDLLRRLAQGCRLLTVLGVGGLGKTRLVLQALRALQVRSWLCELNAVRSRRELVAAVGRAMGLAMVHGEPEEQLLAALQGSSGVLILDGMEHLIEEAAGLLGRWLAEAEGVSLVVTSRRRLSLQGEHLLELAPLSPEDARALLLDRLQAVQQGIPDEAALERLLLLLEGLPLAVELAASRLRWLSIAQLCARIQADRSGALRDDSRDRAARHATLGALLEDSWALLPPEGRRALVCCSIFQAPFTLEAAGAVLAGGEEHLELLLDHSLLLRDEGDRRLSMLAMVREFAAEKLDDVELFRDRHAAYFSQRRALGELADITAAGRWSIRRGALDQAVSACLACWEHWFVIGPLEEGWSMARDLLAQPGLSDHQRARVEIIAGVALRRLARPGAEAHLQRALSLAQGDPGLISDACHALGTFTHRVGRVEEAMRWHQQALLGADPFREARARAACGVLLQERERFSEALAEHQAALVGYTLLGARREEAVVRGNLGHLSRRQGQLTQALQHYRDALRIHRQLGDLRSMGELHAGIARTLWRAGRWQEAAEHSAEAQRLLRQVGDRQGEAMLLTDASSHHQASGRFPEALSAAEEALRLYRAIGSRHGEAVVLGNLGNLHRERGQPGLAHGFHDAALRLHRLADDQRFIGLVLGCSGEALLDEGRLEEAEARLTEAIRLTGASGFAVAEGVFRGCLGVLLARRGEPGAEAQLQAALRLLEPVGEALELGRLHCRIAECAALAGDEPRRRQAREAAEAIRGTLPLSGESELDRLVDALA
jgi:tetratricopeptide (TPR) repeat protein